MASRWCAGVSRAAIAGSKPGAPAAHRAPLQPEPLPRALGNGFVEPRQGRHDLAQRGSAGMASQNEIPASPGRRGISQPDFCKRAMDAAPDGAE